MSAVAVVGLGQMGSRIARRVLEVGHDVVVWNRTYARTADLVDLGARAVPTPAAAAAEAEFLITIVADPEALRAASRGPNGICAGAHDRLTVIEMSTVGPAAVGDLRASLPPQTDLLDAPVLGSVIEASAGTLVILAGGPDPVLERTRPLLTELGSVVHVGGLCSGAAAKLVANAALFGTVALLGETISFGRDLGLTDDAVFEVLAATPLADQAQRRRHVIAAGEYPRRFALSLAVKDADLIAAAARANGTELRLVDAGRSWLADAAAAGLGDRDYTSVLATITADAGEVLPATVATALDEWDFDGLIVDLDGVVWLGGEAIRGAVEAVAALRARGKRLLFLTNDPSSSRAEQAARLRRIGIPATADDVMTAAAATAQFLAGRRDLRGRTVFVIGSPALRQELADAGFELVEAPDAPRAELVVVGGHRGFDFAELRAATRAVAAGAALFAAGRDRFVPTAEGPEPATGAVLAAVEAATGVTATVVGKPEPYMFELGRQVLADCERVAVVGDNVASDIAGAKRCGLDAILVLTGATSAAELGDAEHQPDIVLDSLAELQAFATGRAAAREALGISPRTRRVDGTS